MILDGYSYDVGWYDAEAQLFKDIKKETGHLTLASLISEWRSLSANSSKTGVQ